MIHALIYHGFPINMKPAMLERSIYHDIINQIDRQYIDEKNLVINSTWMNWDFQHACEALLSVYQPDNVFIGSIVDPWNSMSWAEDKFPKSKIIIFGNTDGEYSFNYWSYHCAHYFPEYQEEDLALDDDPMVFLCYQLKPKIHRQVLTHKLIQRGLDCVGILTLGDTEPFIFPSLTKRTLHSYGHLFGEIADQDGIGDLGVWQQCFLNVVSETEIKPTEDLFVSEKTWKPILGLRPFIINGDSRIYRYLEEKGFDVFGDIFPVEEIKKSSGIDETTNIIVEVIKDLSGKPDGYLKKLWVDLYPRLCYNRSRFYEFAREQKSKIQNLFEKATDETTLDRKI